jgi:uncharacterized protein
MNERDRAILNQFRDLVTAEIPEAEIVVFGSRARGDADRWSDMDVLVLVPRWSQEVENLIAERAWEVGFEHELHISFFVHSKGEWQNGPLRDSLLAKAIRMEGIPA